MDKPYIGITGFMCRQEVEIILRQVPDYLGPRCLMTGMLVSSKTLRGAKNKYPNRYPPPEMMGSVFIDDPRVMNIIHYATDDKETLLRQLTDATHLAGPYVHGVQLNMRWPDPAVVRAYKHRFPGSKVVLQIGESAFKAMNYNPSAVSHYMTDYLACIDYVLLDQSGGKGSLLDPKVLEPYIAALEETHPTFRVGIAGDLSAETLHSVAPLFQKYQKLSIDTESGVRDRYDALDTRGAVDYVNTALKLLP